MPQTAFHLHEPDDLRSCVVFASPHSGREYSWSFLRHTILDEHTIRSSEDAYVDRLFDCAPQFGAPLLRAVAPRAFVDLNRNLDELDPALIDGVRRSGHNPRVASGLGVIPRVVANGRAIYRGKISRIEAERRINAYWRPYHAVLKELMHKAHTRFGRSVLVDCHSMPHEAVSSTVRNGTLPPQIVIGDRFGASASGEIVDAIEAAFRNVGLRVARNAPFAGAYITQHYGRPARNQHAIQIEIDRAVYMDEQNIRPNARFQEIRTLLRSVVAEIAVLSDGEAALAAE